MFLEWINFDDSSKKYNFIHLHCQLPSQYTQKIRQIDVCFIVEQNRRKTTTKSLRYFHMFYSHQPHSSFYCVDFNWRWWFSTFFETSATILLLFYFGTLHAYALFALSFWHSLTHSTEWRSVAKSQIQNKFILIFCTWNKFLLSFLMKPFQFSVVFLAIFKQILSVNDTNEYF